MAAAALCLWACQFDGVRSTRCSDDSYCPSGQLCVDEICVSGTPVDSGLDTPAFAPPEVGIADATQDARVSPDAHDGGLAELGIDAGEGGWTDTPVIADAVDDLAHPPDLPDRRGDADRGGDLAPCDGGEINACGGCQVLEYTVGAACGGGECGWGEWACDGIDALVCETVAGEVNVCGGCETLAGYPGESCGDCGLWQCSLDGESVLCDDPGNNACGGCESLAVPPGTACGVCLDGAHECSEDGDSTFCLGASPGNACGGCGELMAEPFAPCGACSDGAFLCSDDGAELICTGATPGNACGGCGELVAEPLTDCGDCGAGHYECSEDGSEVFCADATPFNACGGCGDLEADPSTRCGDCDDGLWTCSPTGDAVTCVGGTELNACLACGLLEGEPGAPCGDDGCEAGVWICDDAGAVECIGVASANACGGCAELDGEPGGACGCGDEGGTWVCAGEDHVVCRDGDDTPDDAHDLGTLGEGEATGWLDATDDRDWYVANTPEPEWGDLEPTVRLSSSDDDFEFELCIFYAYTTTRNIIDYDCGDGDQCRFYDASRDEVRDTSCSAGSEDFDSDTDLYGCCEDDFDDDDDFEGWTARVTEVQGWGDESGTTYVMVTQTDGGAPECIPYALSVTVN